MQRIRIMHSVGTSKRPRLDRSQRDGARHKVEVCPITHELVAELCQKATIKQLKVVSDVSDLIKLFQEKARVHGIEIVCLLVAETSIVQNVLVRYAVQLG